MTEPLLYRVYYTRLHRDHYILASPQEEPRYEAQVKQGTCKKYIVPFGKLEELIKQLQVKR